MCQNSFWKSDIVLLVRQETSTRIWIIPRRLILQTPSWGSFRRKKRQKRARRHKSALQMPSKNRSDKGDSTMKATVNPRKEKSRNPSNLGGFGMVPVVGLEPTRCRQQRILSRWCFGAISTKKDHSEVIKGHQNLR